MCPNCGQQRQTACPVCGTAGCAFSLAEYLAPPDPEIACSSQCAEQPAGAPESLEVLLVCAQCDEVFAPEFYRRCPQCGHDYGEGIEVARPQTIDWSPRVVLVIALMALGGFALLLYFWYLLSK